MTLQGTQLDRTGISSLSDVTRTLRWRNETQLSEVVSLWVSSAAIEQFSIAVARIRRFDDRAANAILSLTKEIGEEGVRRVGCAPESLHRTSLRVRMDQSTAAFLVAALEAEQLREEFELETATLRIRDKRQLWTALNDYCFSIGDERLVGMIRCGRGVFKARATTFGSILDFGFTTTVGTGSSTIRPYGDDSELICDSTRIDSAFFAISAMNPAAAKMVSEQIKQIVVRRDARLGSFGSSSMPTYIGRIVLRNVCEMTEAALESALIHESIHLLLSSIELRQPFVDLDDSSPLRVVSPWSGKPLGLRTYIHACFVWFGLVNFWVSEIGKSIERSDAEEQLGKAVLGFRGENPMTKLIPHRTHVDPEVYETVEAMQAAVLGI